MYLKYNLFYPETGYTLLFEICTEQFIQLFIKIVTDLIRPAVVQMVMALQHPVISHHILIGFNPSDQVVLCQYVQNLVYSTRGYIRIHFINVFDNALCGGVVVQMINGFQDHNALRGSFQTLLL